jgi:secondary thiamine-phosphate synthase enzyme
MRITGTTLNLATQAPIELIDIGARVEEAIAGLGLREGLVTVLSPHTTAAVALNEREAGLQADMVRFLEGLAPRTAPYLHNRAPVDGRDNAHAHLLGLLMSASQSIPVAGGALQMGGWQSLFFVELDGPRPQRQLHLHCLGED